MFRGMAAPKTRKYQVHSRATVLDFIDKRDDMATVGDLAAATGLSFKTVSLSINGAAMTWATVSRLAHALDVQPDAIADEIRDHDPQEVA